MKLIRDLESALIEALSSVASVDFVLAGDNSEEKRNGVCVVGVADIQPLAQGPTGANLAVRATASFTVLGYIQDDLDLSSFYSAFADVLGGVVALTPSAVNSELTDSVCDGVFDVQSAETRLDGNYALREIRASFAMRDDPST